jgi:hypothetical protein
MALQPQYTAIPLGAGIEQKSVEELIEPPMLLQAHNCTLTREGELTKRFGWGPVVSQDMEDLGQPARLVKRGSELVWIEDTFGTVENGNRSVARSRIVGEVGEYGDRIWHERGHPSRFNTREFLRIPGTYGSPAEVGFLIGATDIAFAGTPDAAKGVLCAVWRPSEQTGLAEIRYAVFDVETKAVIYQGVIASGGTLRTKSQIRVVGVRHTGQKWYFHVFYERDYNGTTRATRDGGMLGCWHQRPVDNAAAGLSCGQAPTRFECHKHALLPVSLRLSIDPGGSSGVSVVAR